MSTRTNNKMRTSPIMKSSISIVLLAVTVCFSYGQRLTSFSPIMSSEKAQEVMEDNEFERGEIGESGNTYYCNPLLLNGKSLEYGTFTINSKGELAVVKGEPGSSRSIRIPFFVRLRRDGKILDDQGMDFSNRKLYNIEISKVLAFSKAGDQLIVEPFDKADWIAKRILKLIL